MNSLEAVTAQLAAIKTSLDDAYSSLANYSGIAKKNAGNTSLESTGETNLSHRQLLENINALYRAVQGPANLVFAQIENAVQSGCTRALLELGLFDALPMDMSSVSSKALAEQLKIEEDLLIRLMRITIINGVFVEPKPNEYAHSGPNSLIYMDPGFRAVYKLMVGDYMPVFHGYADFFKQNGWKTPTSQTNNPYTFTHHVPDGLNMWEHVQLNQERAQYWNLAMQAQGTATEFAIGMFPFEAEFKKIPTTDDTVLLVDVGGGLGHATKKIKELSKDVKGKIILQDRPEVLAEIKDELWGIERMGHDFFTPNPVKGALVYYIRRCLHDWSDDSCVEILKNISCSMEPGVSRLLIAECILPSARVDAEGCWLDITMMAFTGRERNREQWEKILGDSGLRLEKTYTVPGTHYGVVEAYLA